MRALVFTVFAFTFCFPAQAISDTLRYVGIINVNNKSIPAKATYEVVEGFKDPRIQIYYEISGKDYLSAYMSGFGDKFKINANSIEVYNDGPDKRQNYYFTGKHASWIEYITY